MNQREHKAGPGEAVHEFPLAAALRVAFFKDGLRGVNPTRTAELRSIRQATQVIA